MQEFVTIWIQLLQWILRICYICLKLQHPMKPLTPRMSHTCMCVNHFKLPIMVHFLSAHKQLYFSWWTDVLCTSSAPVGTSGRATCWKVPGRRQLSDPSNVFKESPCQWEGQQRRLVDLPILLLHAALMFVHQAAWKCKLCFNKMQKQSLLIPH